jgi:hypothetical protein
MTADGGVEVLGRMSGPFGVLRGNRNLQLLFGGQVVSSLGDWLYVLALGILAYEIRELLTAQLLLVNRTGEAFSVRLRERQDQNKTK